MLLSKTNPVPFFRHYDAIAVGFSKKIVTMGTFEWLTNCFTDVFTCQSTDN